MSETTTIEPLESLESLSPEAAADPKIRIAILRIRKRQVELAIRDEVRGAAVLRERPRWGPCTRCGHQWEGYWRAHPPLHCARCHSRYWQELPKQTRARTPDMPPSPNWKPIKGKRGNQYTTGTARRPPRPEWAHDSTLPSPPRAEVIGPVPLPGLPKEPVRPLANYLMQQRMAEEAQPERTVQDRYVASAADYAAKVYEEISNEVETPDAPVPDNPVLLDLPNLPGDPTLAPPQPEPQLAGADACAPLASRTPSLLTDEEAEVLRRLTEAEAESESAKGSTS